MRNSDQLRAAVATEVRELQLLRATLPMRQLIALIDALIESHLSDLITVLPERLEFKQGAIRQLQCLRITLLDDNPHQTPKA
jgi:hypothetical protein